MPSSSKRANAYWLKRLKTEHPSVYEDYKAGKFKSVRAARIAAGLFEIPDHLDGLKRHWKRATDAERHEFIAWIPTYAPYVPVSVDGDGLLTKASIKTIEAFMHKNGWKPADLSEALGDSRNNMAIKTAMRRGKSVNPKTLIKLNELILRHLGR